MGKFVIKRATTNPAAFRSIQVRVSTHDMIKQIQDDTGASLVDLVDAMVRFCAKRLEVEE